MTLDREALARDLRRDEGERLKIYRDTTRHATIGVGRNLDGKGISHEESEFMLANDIEDVVAGLNGALPWWKNLDEVRQRVLANMAFNLGLTGLLKFKRTLESVRVGDYQRAAVQMTESTWAGQVGARAQRLAAMMRTGVDA